MSCRFQISSSAPETFLVRAGSHSNDAGGFKMKVNKISIHEKWDRSALDYDYALIELMTPLTFSDRIQSISLPNIGDQEIPDETICSVSGWGRSFTSDDLESLIVLKLRGVEQPIVNREKCDKAFQGANNITEQMMCGGFLNVGGKSCMFQFK